MLVRRERRRRWARSKGKRRSGTRLGKEEGGEVLGQERKVAYSDAASHSCPTARDYRHPRKRFELHNGSQARSWEAGRGNGSCNVVVMVVGLVVATVEAMRNVVGGVVVVRGMVVVRVMVV